ncbi:MAG: glycine cleavage system aminomethyltransferase GcvT [Clostridiaceae bacterium]|nr:glycine cleavage system aminomethyltransferase GcvT [Clostridiaceae bacterium]
MNKRTPLYETQKSLGAKFISFGGWELPVSYSDILKEHHAVRNNAGLFDVSHMGMIFVTGRDSLKFVDNLVTNDISSAPCYKAVYCPMCYENGTVVDDVLVYKISDTRLFIVANASNTEKDFKWISSHIFGDVKVEDLTSDYVLLALQGPKSGDIIRKLTDDNDLPGFFRFKETTISGMNVILSRTGYTGEDGFELYLNIKENGSDPVKLWNDILNAGKDEGLLPAGLGARDTLRLEAALPLYGHELSEEITPLEAGLDRFVKFNKENFIGKKALVQQAENFKVQEDLKRKIYGFEMLDRGIPRNGYEVLKHGETIGYVTSGGPLPTLNINGGLALLEGEDLNFGDEVEIRVRNRDLKAKIVEIPFYKRSVKK